MKSKFKNFFINFFKKKNSNIFDYVEFIKNMKKQKKRLDVKKTILKNCKKT